MRKEPYKVKTYRNLREAPARYLMMIILNGEKDLSLVAHERRAEPVILRGLFNSDLQPLGTNWAEVNALSLDHQLFVAELMASMLKRAEETNEQKLGREQRA